MTLDNKVCLITGAARGIGAATAKLCTQKGAKVMLADVNVKDGQALAATLPDAEFVELDVSDEDAWQAAIARTVDVFGKLDVLVNNAGLYFTSPIEEMRRERFIKLFEVNQLGVFLGMKSAIPAMKANGGSIVNLSSTSGLTGNQNSVGYGGTKWAVRGMSKVAAVELGQYNIRVNSVHPGLTDTPMNHEQMGHELIEKAGKKAPLGRAGQAEDIARVIAFLASDEASFCSGGEFTVDGAMSAGTMRRRFIGTDKP